MRVFTHTYTQADQQTSTCQWKKFTFDIFERIILTLFSLFQTFTFLALLFVCKNSIPSLDITRAPTAAAIACLDAICGCYDARMSSANTEKSYKINIKKKLQKCGNTTEMPKENNNDGNANKSNNCKQQVLFPHDFQHICRCRSYSLLAILLTLNTICGHRAALMSPSTLCFLFTYVAALLLWL